jgi:hypothetical protein
MKKKICKRLMDKAERETIGQSKLATRKLYRQNKREWKQLMKDENTVIVKLKLSKRQQRLTA